MQPAGGRRWLPGKDTRVTVYWPNNSAWFVGTVKDHRTDEVKHELLVNYDDGDLCWHDVDVVHILPLCQTPCSNLQGIQPPTQAPPLGAAPAVGFPEGGGSSPAAGPQAAGPTQASGIAAPEAPRACPRYYSVQCVRRKCRPFFK